MSDLAALLAGLDYALAQRLLAASTTASASHRAPPDGEPVTPQPQPPFSPWPGLGEPPS
jgi:hypothetical protein